MPEPCTKVLIIICLQTYCQPFSKESMLFISQFCHNHGDIINNYTCS